MSKITDAQTEECIANLGDICEGDTVTLEQAEAIHRAKDVLLPELRALRSKSEAVPFAWAYEYQHEKGEMWKPHLTHTPIIEGRYDARHIRNPQPLYTHPAPVTGVSDAMVDRFGVSFWGSNWQRGGFETVRAALAAALTEEGA